MNNILKEPYEISVWDDYLAYRYMAFIDPLYYVKEAEYNKNTDYRAIIESAVSNDDYPAAAHYEQLRNLKILKGDSGKYKDYTFEYTAHLRQGTGDKTLPDNLKGDDVEFVLYEDYSGQDSDIPPLNDGRIRIAQPSIFKERKIAIIGSDTMSAPWRAVNPIFTKNVNGSSTLTFTMYSKYYDEDRDELLDNPFTKLLVNERKIKLRYKGEWRDLIVKNVQENSDNKTYTYTAKDLFINELSKTGYNLVFDSELENNLGTIDYLADQILDGSDWKRRDGDIIRQYKEEPLYLIKVTKGFTAHRMLNLLDEVGADSVNIEVGTYIYGFYQSVNANSSFFQFLYRADLAYDKYPKDDDRVILNTPNYYIDDAIDSATGNFKYFNKASAQVTDQYRGRRLIRDATTKYDPVSDKYVTVYKDSAGKTVYGYTEYEYLTSDSVKNYIVNPRDFTSIDGWQTDSDKGLKLYTDPPINSGTISDDTEFKTYIKWRTDGYLVNSCIVGNRSLIKAFAKGEKYTIRVKYLYTNEDKKLITTVNNWLNFYIAPYEFVDNKYSIIEDKKIFTFSGGAVKGSDEYFTLTAACSRAVSYNDLLNNNYALFIERNSTANVDYYIEDLQLFKYVIGENSEQIYPNSEIASEVRTKYIYYRYDPNIKDADLIKPIYQGYSPSTEFAAQYNAECEKRRSIKASESNRFNLIQSLCETFECWAKFEIEHNESTGEILLDDTGRQKKWVSFHEYIGKDNYVGFKYGINLKSIQRTLDSDAIASKLIVKNNSNEFATDGFCSISRAEENPTGENFLLDFTYYINQGLLDFSQFNNDLYLTTTDYLGYYQKLRELNSKIEENSKLQAELTSKTLPQLRSEYDNCRTSIESGNELLLRQKDYIYQATKETYDALLKDKNNKWWNDNGIYGTMLSIARLSQNIKEYEKQIKVIKKSLDDAEKKQKQLESEIKKIVEQKEVENLKFYKKYSRYIQEGAWTSEDYIDDNLYYLDAESTLHTSSQPKVTYTINVIELSRVEGYELYQFDVGDKTFIEDTEFFGWVDSIRSTPYKEEVVVTEVKYSLDDPIQNTITIKNYKTQFEDLFQRITAIATSVQFSAGEYKRAANVVNADGTLDASAVQNSITNNSIVLSNSNNESIIWDASGITTKSLSRPNEMVRVVGGGIFLSKDFGKTWSTGITGTGINANYINAGQIDTNLVRVMNGSYPTFRWDSSGLSAYYFEQDSTGALTNYSQSRFVRLDQYGLYGINSDSSFNANEPDNIDGPSGEEKIKKHSNFYLTWSGFGIKTDSGAVSITSDNELQVFSKKKDGNNEVLQERIKIGTLDANAGIYGMRLFDNDGNVTLETGSNGQLYLKKTIEIAPSKYSAASRTRIGPSVGYNESGQVVGFNDSSLAYSKIFSVNSIAGTETIAFYDNGLLEAYNAKIIGKLEAGSVIADEAKLGGENGITVGDLSGGFKQNSDSINAMKGIDIASSAGTTFKADSAGNIVPSSITFELRDRGVMVTTNPNVTWYLANSIAGIENDANVIGTGINVTITYDDIKEKFKNGQCYIYAKYLHPTPTESNPGTTTKYTAYRELNLIKDGENGQDAITYKIESSEGFLINDSDTAAPLTTTLTARLYDGTSELDPDGNWVYTWYDKTNNEVDFTVGGVIGTGKSIVYDLTKFDNYSQIYFTVDTNAI